MKNVALLNNVLFNSMGLKRGESLLFITDRLLYPIADLFYGISLKLGPESLFVKIPDMEVDGQEPSSAVAKILKTADVALLMTSKSLSHTRARREASKSGVRIASMPGISYEVAMRSLSLDYREIKRLVKMISDKLSKAKMVRVLTSKGTDISFSIESRIGLGDYGIYKNKGDFGNLPAGEAFIAPLEGSANGVIVIDGSIAGLGRLSKDVKVWIERGRLIKSKPSKFMNSISSFGDKALNLAEFGIGLNPEAKVTGNVLEDEKVLNTAHFAFGTNKSFGGKVDAGIHIDAVFFDPKIYLDSKRLNLS
ncbi:MAG: aminopeptidase [Candidatus Kaelpia aquatica]|nr:aminopeptidase [Candidatus Kaelpia aquatica]